MKYLPAIVGALLGLLFIASGLTMLLGMVPAQEPPPEGSPMAHFFAAFGPTGYLSFIKVLEIVGGVLLAIPRTRNLGLLTLGPIIVNIIAFHVFITRGVGLLHPVLIGIVAATLFLLWAERRAFAALVRRPA